MESATTRCEICDQLIFAWESLPHNCPPRFRVRLVGEPAWRLMYSRDPLEVAASYASRVDWESGNFSIAAGEAVEVEVEDPEGTVRRYRVVGEPYPRYVVKEVS